MERILTFITDFGLEDPYVGEMKGVALRTCPGVRFVDITHAIPPHDIRRAAVVLWASYKWFPKNTVHVVVVDPGVGTGRKGIIIMAGEYFFVGPDNGVMYYAAREAGIRGIWEIDIRSLGAVSHTFHGRDVFAPVAARIACGSRPSDLGRRMASIKTLPFKKPRVKEGVIEGGVIYVDRFGNLITNIAEEIASSIIKIGDVVEVKCGNSAVKAVFAPSYGYVRPGDPVVVVGGFGLLEVAVNQGSARNTLGCGEDQRIIIRRVA